MVYDSPPTPMLVQRVLHLNSLQAWLLITEQTVSLQCEDQKHLKNCKLYRIERIPYKAVNGHVYQVPQITIYEVKP